MNVVALTQAIQVALKASQMYTEVHPKTQAALESLHQVLQAEFKQLPAIHLAGSQGKLFINGQPTDTTNNVHASALVRQLAERNIAGFVINPAVTPEELLGTLKLLSLKPAKMEEQGGIEQVFAQQRFQHISLGKTQYKAVSQHDHAQGQDEDGSTAYLVPVFPGASSGSLSKLVSKLQAGFQNLLLDQEGATVHAAQASHAVTAANLSKLIPLADELGLATPSHPAGAINKDIEEALAQALNTLQSDSLFSIFAGIGNLPKGAENLAKALHDLSPQLISNAVVGRIKAGSPWEPIEQQLFELLQHSPAQQAVLHHLDTSFHHNKMDPHLLNHLFRQLTWEAMSQEEKVRRVNEGESFWTLQDSQRVAYLTERLQQNAMDDFQACMEQVLQQLNQDPLRLRESAARLVSLLLDLMEKPGLPAPLKSRIQEALVGHFVWEPLPHVLDITTQNLEKYLSRAVLAGRLGESQELLQSLENLSTFMGDSAPWRDQALQRLKEHLTTPDLVKPVLQQMYQRNVEEESNVGVFLPYFTALGPKAAASLMQVLEKEEDSKRRKRLMELIRSMGPLALPVVKAGLQSDKWYLVRNCLILLTDLGDEHTLQAVEPYLQHPDPRVQRTAVRALWKLGNQQAAPLLVERLLASDPETQLEILFGLSQIKAPSSLPALHDMAKNQHLALSLRLKVLEVIGGLRAASSLPPLLELVKRQGRIFSSAEPTELRVAAAKALVAIGSPEAKAGLEKVVAEEPANRDQVPLKQALDLFK